MVDKHYSRIRFFAYTMGAIVVGSLLTDLDHILPPFQRSWSDNYYFPVILGCCLGIACLGRPEKLKIIRSAILKHKQ